MEDSNTELEAFRQQWRAEVSAKGRSDHQQKPSAHQSKHPRKQAFAGLAKYNTSAPVGEDDQKDSQSSYNPGEQGKPKIQHGESSRKGAMKEPKSALEHYEKAVEREDLGSLGDSLDLYRKAFRMDDQVDKIYKNKHFPATALPSKVPKTNLSNSPATVPNTTHHSLDGPPKPVKELVASFSGLKIEPAPPAIEGTPAHPCPLSELPEEILIHILTELAVQDVASLVRLTQVCKRLAFLVSTEEQVWRQVCRGYEVGFGAMHYEWQREVLGGPVQEEAELEPEDSDISFEDNVLLTLDKDEITESLLQTAYSSSWRQMFRLRPRIRFNGCYISTVNYIRAGQASQSQVTWSSPVHIVTYFRYLRFFRDGTVISLLTTVEPADVVHHLTKELQETHRGGAAAYLPSIFMEYALRGRWRLSNVKDNPTANLKDAEGDLFVETEGPNEKYLYRMKLSLRSAGKGARNNKLVWQGFWNYNIITDDTGEFTLRNDKAFYFSRVKSYGTSA